MTYEFQDRFASGQLGQNRRYSLQMFGIRGGWKEQKWKCQKFYLPIGTVHNKVETRKQPDSSGKVVFFLLFSKIKYKKLSFIAWSYIRSYQFQAKLDVFKSCD